MPSGYGFKETHLEANVSPDNPFSDDHDHDMAMHAHMGKRNDLTALGLLSLKALPSVCIIGAPKGGTTDLYDQLTWRLNLTVPRKKETGYLGNGAIRKSKTEYAKILNHPCGNESLAPAISINICLESYPSLTVDATTSYLEYPNIAENLELLSPNTLVIALLREPLDRAVSHYNQWKTLPGIRNITNSFAAKRFLEFVQKDAVARIFSELLASNSLTEIKNLYKRLVQLGLLDPRYMRLFGGSLYAYSLATWATTFCKPEKCIIINSHWYFHDRSHVIKDLLGHLNINHGPSPATDNLENKPASNQKPTKLNSSYINEELQESLQNFFRPHNQKLRFILDSLEKHYGAKLIGFNSSDAFSGWL
jgi:hypothetical protein